MATALLGGLAVHYRITGPRDGVPVVFSNSLGTDFRTWDGVIDALPEGLRILCYDMRGHGLTDAPEGDYFMGDMVADAATLMDHVGMTNALVVGLSVGGLIAQGLAAERPDLVRAMVLMDTAAKIGTEGMWRERMDAMRTGGIVAMADNILERWFSKAYPQEDPAGFALARNMLVRTPLAGYLGCAAAISQTDLMESTARLSLPTLAICGSEDGATPPDLVRETAKLIKGARFELIEGAGHLPGVEKPDVVATLIADFLNEVRG